MGTVLLIGAAVAQPLFSQPPSPQAVDREPSSSSVQKLDTVDAG
jgi:hypothetical protein